MSVLFRFLFTKFDKYGIVDTAYKKGASAVSLLKEFFGFGGYQREAEGFFSLEHILFVSALVAVMIALAVWLGMRNKGKPFSQKIRVLMTAA